MRGLSLDLLTWLRFETFGPRHDPTDSPAVVVGIDEDSYQTPPLKGSPLPTWTGEIGRVLGAMLEDGLRSVTRKAGVPACVQRVGSMITLFFQEGPVRSWDDAAKSDTKRFGEWHKGLIERGVYWPPSQYEAAFLSGAHTEDDIARTVEAARAAL